MQRTLRLLLPAVLLMGAGTLQKTFAQALPTSSAQFRLSAFGGVTGVKTGYLDGKNLGVSAGVNFNFWEYHKVHFAAEYRGTLPLDKGNHDGQKVQLIGLQASFPVGRFHPYGDFFFGRGEISYAPPGAEVPNTYIIYTRSSSNVLAPGGGVDIDLTPHLAFKADIQLERYSVPVTTSGKLNATSGTLGFIYHFHFKPFKQ